MFKFLRKREESPQFEQNLYDLIMRKEILNKKTAMGVPALSTAVNLICGICANTKFKLYKLEGDKYSETFDYREKFLNSDTGDTLNAYEMKKAFIRDYLLMGNGYIYINKKRNRVESLHYVDEIDVAVQTNCDPIFKKAMINVGTKQLVPADFLIVTRNSVDGVTGKGIIHESTALLNTVKAMLNTLNTQSVNQGAKRGFLKANKRLGEAEMKALKEGFKALYSSDENGVVVLNEGMDFQELTTTIKDLELSTFYSLLSNETEKLLLIPPTVLDGTAKEETYKNWFKTCITPILNEICASLNESLLLEREKGIYLWRADTKEMEDGDLKSLFEAYKIALDSNMLQLDEVREKIGATPLGFNFLKIGLGDVLYDPEKQTVYTPNTNAIQQMGELTNGEKTENNIVNKDDVAEGERE